MSQISERIDFIVHKFHGDKRGNYSAFARKMGMATGLLSIWIKGESEPGPDYRRKICELYGINMDWLDTGEGEPFAQKVEQEQNISHNCEAELRAAQDRIADLERIIAAKDEIIALLKNTHAPQQDKAAPPHEDDRGNARQASGGG